MTPQEMIAHCQQQIAFTDAETAKVGLLLRGSYGSGEKALCAGGPVGKVVKENPDGTVLVFFKAQAVLDFITSAL